MGGEKEVIDRSRAGGYVENIVFALMDMSTNGLVRR